MTLPTTGRRGIRRPGSVLAAAAALVAGLVTTSCGGSTVAITPPTTGIPEPTLPYVAPSPSADASAALTDDQLLDLAHSSVVRIRTTGCGSLAVGSAWMTDDGSLVSNRHVVDGYRIVEASTWDGRDLDVRGVAVADDATTADLSRLLGDWAQDAPGLRPLPIRTDRAQPGERLSVLGFAQGDEASVISGPVVDYLVDERLAPREILRFDAPILPGDSGGPVVDGSGRVVAVAYAVEIATGYALAVPISDVVGPTAAPLTPLRPCA